MGLFKWRYDNSTLLKESKNLAFFWPRTCWKFEGARKFDEHISSPCTCLWKIKFYTAFPTSYPSVNAEFFRSQRLRGEEWSFPRYIWDQFRLLPSGLLCKTSFRPKIIVPIEKQSKCAAELTFITQKNGHQSRMTREPTQLFCLESVFHILPHRTGLWL